MSKKSDQFVPYFLVNFNLNKKLDEKSEDFAFHQNSNMNDSLTEIDHLTMSDFSRQIEINHCVTSQHKIDKTLIKHYRVLKISEQN